MPRPVVDILMYHSISDQGGPTSIAPAVFADQMAALAEAGIPVIRLDDLLAARDGSNASRGHKLLPEQSVILTFDDGFRDFADTAFPILNRYHFPSIVYLPTAHIGRAEAWRGANSPARPLISWNGVRDLAAEGVDFGSHTVSHPDLCALAPGVLAAELTRSRAVLEDRLGRSIKHFAPPYGRADPAVRAEIARHYGTSVGTRLARARTSDDVHDLPRLEMFYFTNPKIWRQHLRQQGGPYLLARQAMRRVKSAISMPWDAA